MNNLTPEQFKNLDEVSSRNLNSHNDAIKTAYKTMNNIIFVVSTGSLVLSIAIVKDVQTAPGTAKILIISWFLLIITIALNFTAQWLTGKYSMRVTDLINQERGGGFPNGFQFQKKVILDDDELKKYKKWMDALNPSVIIVFLLGLGLLFWFTSINMLAKEKASEMNYRNKSYYSDCRNSNF